MKRMSLQESDNGGLKLVIWFQFSPSSEHQSCTLPGWIIWFADFQLADDESIRLAAAYSLPLKILNSGMVVFILSPKPPDITCTQLSGPETGMGDVGSGSGSGPGAGAGVGDGTGSDSGVGDGAGSGFGDGLGGGFTGSGPDGGSCSVEPGQAVSTSKMAITEISKIDFLPITRLQALP